MKGSQPHTPIYQTLSLVNPKITQNKSLLRLLTFDRLKLYILYLKTKFQIMQIKEERPILII